CQLELEALKEEKSDVTRMFRVKIRETEEKIHTLAAQLDEGTFERKFEVVEEPDDERLLIDIKRKDTGERIDTRPMTELEKESVRQRRQGELFGDSETEPAPPPDSPPRLRPINGGG